MCVVLLALDEALGIVDAKAILSRFAEKIPHLKPTAVAKELAIFTLTKMQPRLVSFEEQVQ